MIALIGREVNCWIEYLWGKAKKVGDRVEVFFVI